MIQNSKNLVKDSLKNFEKYEKRMQEFVGLPYMLYDSFIHFKNKNVYDEYVNYLIANSLPFYPKPLVYCAGFMMNKNMKPLPPIRQKHIVINSVCFLFLYPAISQYNVLIRSIQLMPNK